MHKKGHLEERLEACSQILTVADLSEKNMKRAAEQKDYLPLKEMFGNSNPGHLEMAKLHPDINFVAVEQVSNVIIDAVEQALKDKLKNVYFINCAAEVLPKYFENGTFERIYLNFSNPLPKLGYVKQRLTHPRFLAVYKQLLVGGGEIWQKTDSKDFYEFSCQSYVESGFEIVEKCEDLKNHPFEGNVVTEHENKFMQEGLPIYRVVARVK
jgi:tRNA (guanine-N7-)-methyltransferase